MNDDGLASCKAEDLVNEIEYILKCPGRLVIERRYTNIYRDYSENLRWGADGAVVRCIEKGSVLRIRTTDGDPIDIFPLMNCFVGEDLLFPEEVLVKKEYTDIPGIPEKLRVINRYHYSENDTLVLKDYRIAAP